MAYSSSVPSSCSENRGAMIVAVTYILLCIAILAVFLRLYVRLGLRIGKISSDDYTIAASLVAAIIGVGCLTKFVFEGLGKHIYCLPVDQIPQAVKWSVIAQIFNVIGIGLAKISVCLSVLRIINRTGKKLVVFLWIIIAFAAASHLVQVMLFLVQCRPIAAIWDPRIRGKCFSSHYTYLAGYIGFGLDAFTDLVCAGIPVFIFYRTQMNQRQKIALCVLMGLGALTSGCAIAKAVTLKGVFANDYTWDIVAPAMCTITEHLVGLSLVSAPALGPLFGKLFDMAASRTNSYGFMNRRQSRWTPAVSGDAYAPNMYLYSNDARRSAIPSYNSTIVRTTSFRVGSEHTSEIGQHTDDYWPPPLSSVHTAGAERFEKSAL